MLAAGIILLISVSVWAQNQAPPGITDPKAAAKNGEDGPETTKSADVELAKDDADFKSIKDRTPGFDSKERPAEFSAFVRILAHARMIPTDALGQPGVPYESLVEDAERPNFLLKFVKIRGKLLANCVKLKLEVPAVLKASGVANIYEASIGFGGDPEKPVSVYFTELPKELSTGDKGNITVELDGYYFKLMEYEVDGVKKFAPLFLAKTIRVTNVEPLVSQADLSEEERVRLNKKSDEWKAVIDLKPLQAWDENPDECRQYDLVFRKAIEFSPEVLRKYARKDPVFADMVGDGRGEFLRDLIHIEGRLVRLRKREAPGRLRDTSPIKEVYDGWILFDTREGELINVAFCELPPGIVPGEKLQYNVAFDGYYFKLLRYDSQEKDAQGKPVPHKAPLLIGRTIELLDQPTSMITSLIPAVMIVFGVLGVGVIGLIFWLRRSDRSVREKTHESLTKLNPFDEQDRQSPPIEPGDAWNRVNDSPRG